MRHDPEQLKRDLVIASRAADRMGLVRVFGHISARIPGTSTFLIPVESSPGSASTERMATMDLDGHRLDDGPLPNREFWIHARIYAARPDVGAVAHLHPPACIALGVAGQSVRPLNNAGMRFGAGVPVYDVPGLIVSRDQGDDLARCLGMHRAMLMRWHGVNVVDEDVRHLILSACELEEAADIQLRASAAVGGDLDRVRWLEGTDLEALVAVNSSPAVVARAWDYYCALT
jgi:ribulose-5-phosphate 4-epimerase/fuculose-1-phosphate aldolase